MTKLEKKARRTFINMAIYKHHILHKIYKGDNVNMPNGKSRQRSIEKMIESGLMRLEEGWKLKMNTELIKLYEIYWNV